MLANKITILTTENYLELSLWLNNRKIDTVLKPLANNFLENYFPAWNELISSTHFNWNKIQNVYVLNGPSKFAILRCLITSLKLLMQFNSHWKIYTLNHLLFQVPNPNLTISLITANKQHYYYGLYKDFKPLQPLKLWLKTDVIKLKNRFQNANVVIDYNMTNFDQLWKTHLPFFIPVDQFTNLKPFYLNPFSLDKIK